MTKQDMIKKIYAEFSTSGMPDSNDLVKGPSTEAMTIKNIFINRIWTELNKEDMILYNSALGFLTKTAFRYYLPAYMIILLNDPYEADIVSNIVVNRLKISLEVDHLRLMHFFSKHQALGADTERFLLEEVKNSTRDCAFFMEHMDGFTRGQGRCINEFLLTLSELYPDYYDEKEPVVASERYWFKYM